MENAIATLMFYDRSLWSKIRGYGTNSPVDLVSITELGKEYEHGKIARDWKIMGYIKFDTGVLTLKEIACDFASKFGDHESMIIWNNHYDVNILQTQRPIIIPAFVEYFSKR